MKQTAVEWLIKELNLEGYDHTIEQAKAMEKEQIKEAYKSCYTPLSFGKIGDLDEDFKEWFEQYKKK